MTYDGSSAELISDSTDARTSSELTSSPITRVQHHNFEPVACVFTTTCDYSKCAARCLMLHNFVGMEKTGLDVVRIARRMMSTGVVFQSTGWLERNFARNDSMRFEHFEKGTWHLED